MREHAHARSGNDKEATGSRVVSQGRRYLDERFLQKWEGGKKEEVRVENEAREGSTYLSR
jgi:hypothetical protein